MSGIYTRISVRKYEDRPVEPEKITELLRAAMQAPSATNQQPWEFYVVTDKEVLEQLSKASPLCEDDEGRSLRDRVRLPEGLPDSGIRPDRPFDRHGESVAEN